MKKFVALFCFIAIVFTLVSCTKKNIPVASDADAQNIGMENGEIIKLLLAPFADEETVGLNLPARNYVSVTANGLFDISSLKFVSDDPNIATISYDSTALENCIYYIIEGVRTGKTTVHIESADGKVRSENIAVTVKRYISTTTQLSIEYKPYKLHTEEYRVYTETTTEKTTQEETTQQTTSEAISSTTEFTIPVTFPTTEFTVPEPEPPTTKKPWWRRR